MTPYGERFTAMPWGNVHMSDRADPQSTTAISRGRAPRLAAILAVVAFGVLMAGCSSEDGGITRPSIDITRPSIDVTLPSITLPERTTTAPPPSSGPAPTEGAPNSSAPETTPPTEPTVTSTEAPTTEAPITLAPEETAPEETVPTDGEPAEDEGSRVPWWPWVLALVVLLGGVGVAAVRSRRRDELVATQSRGLLDQAAEVAGDLSALDAAGLHRLARSFAGRLATLGAELRSTAVATKNPSVAVALNALAAEVGRLHGRVDAVDLQTALPTDASVAAVHEQAARLHALTGQIRAEHFLPQAATP